MSVVDGDECVMEGIDEVVLENGGADEGVMEDGSEVEGAGVAREGEEQEGIEMVDWFRTLMNGNVNEEQGGGIQNNIEGRDLDMYSVTLEDTINLILREQREGFKDINASLTRLTARVGRLEETLAPAQAPRNLPAPGVAVEHVDPEDGNELFTMARLIAIHRVSSSNGNFAVNLARQVFSRQELKSRRVRGKRGVPPEEAQLDPIRLQQVRTNYFRIVDVADSLKPNEWRRCTKAIDAAGRDLLRVEARIVQNEQ